MIDELTDEQVKQWCTEIRMCADCDEMLGFRNSVVVPRYGFDASHLYLRTVATVRSFRCETHELARSRIENMRIHLNGKRAY